MTQDVHQTRAIATAWFLAGLGAVPFVAMALGQAIMPGSANAHLGGDQAFLGYGAVILSFMGGVRWGAALAPSAAPTSAETMILSVAPSLAGWLALLIDRPWSLLLLLAGFGLQGAWDVASARSGALQAWFGKLRLVISTIVAGSILIVLVF
ncbi:Protein of unknown function (DUF3429) [Hoeflea phototrophica DFL-43]|uniref:DUF3429 domain-containing protein n=1 Tax=Hoeflea phototrophica (strain DSM 17068 / NCIMB 14078 / DFL-43) TaxID=411684 RepID=A9DFF0_HOEPD|nr:DUF3429 domain-containing protein [Hoeflea phototrophica]EDQ31759.1 Protein of unknown function (DUF3429) [Hoeflea phototrophica DFL-43]